MKLLYFAWIRSRVGFSEEVVDPPPNVKDIQSLINWLKTRSNAMEDAFQDLAAIRVAVNQNYVEFDHLINAGDEIAFFPPVTGG